MKHIKYVLLVIGVSFIPLSIQAEMVSYVDNDGRMHYVNTDFAKVPEEYRSQIEPKVESNQEVAANQEAVSSENTEIKEASDENQEPIVEILVSLRCHDCQKLELLLKKNNVKYLRYDVDQHPRGQELYKKIGGNLPVTKIGEEIIYGPNIEKIISILRGPGIIPNE